MLKIILEDYLIEDLNKLFPNAVFIYPHRPNVTRFIQYGLCGINAYHITDEYYDRWEVQRQSVNAIGLTENDLKILKSIGVREDYY